MAPSKKRDDVEGSLTKRVTRSENRPVTRSETRKRGSSSALLVSAEVTKQQKKKKAKTPKKTKATATYKEKTRQSAEANTDIADEGKETEPVEEAADDAGVRKLIVIERCTQCSSFKRTATAVKEGLEAAVPGIRVVINPEKPRRGCLEVREDEGRIFLSLLNMKRPFTAMKKLNMAEVIPDLVNQIKD